MTEAQQAAFDTAMKALLSVPWDQREDVCAALRFNKIFCWECGYGEPDSPNKNCQCTNDE